MVSIQRLLGSPASIPELGTGVRDAVVESFVHALRVVFLAALPFAVMAFVLLAVPAGTPIALRSRSGDRGRR